MHQMLDDVRPGCDFFMSLCNDMGHKDVSCTFDDRLGLSYDHLIIKLTCVVFEVR